MADDPKTSKDASVQVNDRRAETRTTAIGAAGSSTIGAAGSATIGAAGNTGFVGPQSADDQPKVSVKPIASYVDSATNEHKSPDSEPYQVSRQRAAELRQNMLVEYASESDEKAEIDAQVKAAGDKRRAEMEARTKAAPGGPKTSEADQAKAKAPPAGSHPPIKTA